MLMTCWNHQAVFGDHICTRTLFLSRHWGTWWHIYMGVCEPHWTNCEKGNEGNHDHERIAPANLTGQRIGFHNSQNLNVSRNVHCDIVCVSAPQQVLYVCCVLCNWFVGFQALLLMVYWMLLSGAKTGLGPGNIGHAISIQDVVNDTVHQVCAGDVLSVDIVLAASQQWYQKHTLKCNRRAHMM